MISFYSIVAGIIWLSVALILIALLRMRTGFMLRYSSELLLFVTLLALVRTLLPLDLKQAYIVRSFFVMPLATDALETALPDGIPVERSLLLIWAGGSVVTLLCEIYAVFHDWNERKRYRVISAPWAVRAARRAQIAPEMIAVSPDLSMPMTLGFFRPRIYLPLTSLNDSQLDWVIRHELQHIKGRDMWLKLLYYPVMAAFWWNPVVWYFSHELNTILEMRCDQAVIRGRTAEERTEYGETLLEVAKWANGQKKNYLASTMPFALPAKKNVALQRIELIVGDTPRKRSSVIAAACVCVALFIASYFVIIQPYGMPPEDEVAGAIVVTEENAYLVHTADDTYELWVDGFCLTTHDKSELDSIPLCDLEIREENKGE